MAPQQTLQPPQHQHMQPGAQAEMNPSPCMENPNYRAAKKLEGKVAFISGGDSGIGQATAVAFGKEGAKVAFSYLDEREQADVNKTTERLTQLGADPLALAGDLADVQVCQQHIQRVVDRYGQLDILVCNAAQQYVRQELTDLPDDQFEHTLRVNVLSAFRLIKAALPHMKERSSIIITISVVAYHGYPTMVDYAASKGALRAMIYSLSNQLVEKGIRINGVAPGPIWTPLIPASFPPEQVAKFGSQTPMKRAGQPCEVAPAYVYLASYEDSSFVTGQVLHVNGGELVDG